MPAVRTVLAAAAVASALVVAGFTGGDAQADAESEHPTNGAPPASSVPPETIDPGPTTPPTSPGSTTTVVICPLAASATLQPGCPPPLIVPVLPKPIPPYAPPAAPRRAEPSFTG